MRWTRLVLLTAVLAACGESTATAPAPPPAQPTSPAQPVPVEEPTPRMRPSDPPLPWPPPPDVPPPVDVPFLREPGVHLHGFVWVEAPPFLVLAEYQQADVRDVKRSFDEKSGGLFEIPLDDTVNPAKVRQNLEWRAKSRLLAERTSRLLTSLHARFRELLAEPLSLPELPADRRLVVVVTRTRELWNTWQSGGPVRGWSAEFRPTAEVACAYFNDDSYMRLDELRCAGDRVQKEFDQDLCFAATHQLFHEHASMVQKRAPSSWAITQPVWFMAGLAHLMSGVECDVRRVETLDGARFTHNRLLLNWISVMREAGRFEPQPWTVRRMFAIRDVAETKNAAKQMATLDRRPEDFRLLAAARWWAFAHYSWFARDGKHRKSFIDVARAVLDGTETPDTAARSYGLTSDADFDALEADFDTYWHAILERKVGRDEVTKVPFEPSTEPPTLK